MKWLYAGILAVFVVHAGALYLMGQPALCACGYVEVWHGVVSDAGNSQHIADWYTLSHIIHGILFYAFFTLLFPRLPLGYRLLLSVGLEAGWEVLENTPTVINHYRQQALAQGYVGDSIINSIADGVAALGGFLAASRMRVWMSVALVVLLECAALYAIRDSLTLNVVQFFVQPEWLAAWQAGK